MPFCVGDAGLCTWAGLRNGGAPSKTASELGASLSWPVYPRLLLDSVHVANIVHKPGIVPFPIPWVIAVAIVAVSISWSMLEYAVKLRRQLKGAVDLEKALDTLSTYFDEGNNQIFKRA